MQNCRMRRRPTASQAHSRGMQRASLWACPTMRQVTFTRRFFHSPVRRFVAGSAGITLTNGGIGSYPLLVGLVIAFYLKPSYPDSSEGIGNALGLLIWVSQTLMMIILGLLSLLLLPKNYSSKDVETTTDKE